jgi:hypothetical protein
MLCAHDTDKLIFFSFGFDPVIHFRKISERYDIMLKDIASLDNFCMGWWGEQKKKKKLHGLSPRANYTDRATAASRRSVANLCG